MVTDNLHTTRGSGASPRSLSGGTSRHQEMYLEPKVAEEGEKPKRKRIVTTFSP